MKEYKVYVMNCNGTVIQWFKPGTNILHREDGPAVECSDGNKFKAWYKSGMRHRLDGPAREWYNGDKEWYQNDKRHRLDGPAIERANGDKEWWIEGQEYSEKKFEAKITRRNQPPTFEGKVVVIDGKEYKLTLV